MFEQLGRWIITAGLLLVVVGVGIWLFGRFAPAGRLLPGDLVIRRPGLTIYVPIATSIAVSLVLSLIMWVLAWLRR
ncbi:MAG: DUF2905 domain-containing protein [Armatimonadetes bacterium]|nr:DUF2905 domain-containing protein [Armatimonadota bacterium]